VTDVAAACPFCKRIAAGEYDREHTFGIWLAAVSFEPLNPVTPGHVLFVAPQHFPDAAASPKEASRVFQAAACYVAERPRMHANLITSIGSAASQTVRHFHLHVVPRRLGDGLALPWGQVPPGD